MMMRRPICLDHFWFGLFGFWIPEKITVTVNHLLRQDIPKKLAFELFGGHFKLNEALMYAYCRQHKIYWQREILLEPILLLD